MIIHAKLILFVICIIEIIIRSNLLLKFINIKNFTLKLSKLFFLKKVSDNWKERVLFNYSKNIFLTSIKIFITIIFIFFFYLLIVNFDIVLRNYFFSIIGFLETSFIALIYLKLRKFKK